MFIGYTMRKLPEHFIVYMRIKTKTNRADIQVENLKEEMLAKWEDYDLSTQRDDFFETDEQFIEWLAYGLMDFLVSEGIVPKEYTFGIFEVRVNQ